MAGGVSVPSLLFGGAVRKTADIPRDVGFLLAGAGMLLLPPMGVEILGVVASVRTPAWVLFPIVGVVALDMVAIGYRVSPEVT